MAALTIQLQYIADLVPSLATDENILMETAQVTCRLSKDPCKHKET